MLNANSHKSKHIFIEAVEFLLSMNTANASDVGPRSEKLLQILSF